MINIYDEVLIILEMFTSDFENYVRTILCNPELKKTEEHLAYIQGSFQVLDIIHGMEYTYMTIAQEQKIKDIFGRILDSQQDLPQ